MPETASSGMETSTDKKAWNAALVGYKEAHEEVTDAKCNLYSAERELEEALKSELLAKEVVFTGTALEVLVIENGKHVWRSNPLDQTKVYRQVRGTVTLTRLVPRSSHKADPLARKDAIITIGLQDGAATTGYAISTSLDRLSDLQVLPEEDAQLTQE